MPPTTSTSMRREILSWPSLLARHDSAFHAQGAVDAKIRFLEHDKGKPMTPIQPGPDEALQTWSPASHKTPRSTVERTLIPKPKPCSSLSQIQLRSAGPPYSHLSGFRVWGLGFRI